MSSRFTDAQLMAIRTRDRNLLVSAGAGAGKTSTLIERLYEILVTPDECPIDQLLVVTFTRAAAQEMRTRLQKRLTEAMVASPQGSSEREWLQSQLLAVPRAQLSTIHSFCLRVLSEHAEKVPLSPSFQLISEGERILWQQEFLRAKLDDLMATDSEETEAVKTLLRHSKATNAVNLLLGWIVDFHAFIESLPDPEGWIDRWTAEGAWDPSDPHVSALWQGRIRSAVARIHSSLEALRPLAKAATSPGLVVAGQEIIALADELARRLIDEAPLDPGAICALLSFGRLSSAKSAGGLTESDEALKKGRADLMKEMSKARETLTALARFSTMQEEGETRRVLRVFTRRLGLQWYRELFDLQVTECRLTFSHLERLTHVLLVGPNGAPTAVADQYRGMFQHVFVDEFQDVNELQESILRAIARPAVGSRGGNFFAVGDVKQSIYEFRQAEPTLFLGLFDRSVNCDPDNSSPMDSRILLQHNFRSDAELLGLFNRLFERLMVKRSLGIDYAAEHRLLAGRTADGMPHRSPEFSLTIIPPERELPFEWMDHVSLEAALVAQKVLEIGPPWRDICILVRTAKGRVSDLHEALSQAGIPVYTSSRSGFLTAVEVVEFQAILRAIENPWLDVDLLGTLRGPAFRWSDSELLDLRAYNREQLFFQNLLSISADESHPLCDKSGVVLESLSRWQSMANHQPMQEFFARLYEELNLLDVALVRPGGEQRRRNLEALLDRAAEFDGFQRKGLARFLQFLDQLIDEGRDLATPAVIPEGADMVQIMTIHASKGMEFPIVLIPFAGARFNAVGRRRPVLWDRHVGIATRIGADTTEEDMTNLPMVLLGSERKRRETCEELRLLYVALTRAERAVHVIGSVESAGVDRMLEQPELHLPPDMIVEARSFAEWVLPWVASETGESAEGQHLEYLKLDRPDPQGLSSLIVENQALADFLRAGTLAPGVTSRRERAAWIARALQGEGGHAAPRDRETGLEPTSGFADALTRVRELAAQTPAPLLRAKLSVTEAKRTWEASRDLETPAFQAPRRSNADRMAWIPERLRTSRSAPASGGSKLGLLMHRFLANMQMHGHGKVLRLKGEVNRQVGDGLLTEAEAASIRLDDLAWFFGTPVGVALLQQQGRLYRERAFSAAVDGASLHAAAAGRTMILQGVLDVLYRGPNGWIVVDYKTDRVDSEERLARLREAYSVQMRLYALLVETTLGEPVDVAHLVFLQAREVVTIRPDAIAIQWEEVLAAGAVIFAEAEDSAPAIRWI
ncbi:AAA family ATPase [bacterium]|nr:AAA family ATPase [bacterium]